MMMEDTHGGATTGRPALTQARVLVTNAEYKHTLAVVRSLGKAGYHVIATDSKRKAQSFFSRYCRERVICPDPKNEEEFIRFLLRFLRERDVDVLLPMGNSTTVAISKHRDELEEFARVPVARYDAVRIASDKGETMRLATTLGIRVPKEYASAEEVDRYPVVAKGTHGSGRVKYVNSPDGFRQIGFDQYILQEYIPGRGYGFYALYNHGELRAYFMHERVREYPITGGPSSCARSICDDELKSEGTKLMGALDWHGVAMVEFKRDSRDGRLTLMEVNPRFWGSLDLSIAAGIDFPRLIVEMALEGDIAPVFDYSTRVKFRWPFPDDMLHLFSNPGSCMEIVAEIFDRNAGSNVWWSDPLPNLVQAYMTPLPILSKLVHGTLRYPHGLPVVPR
ncbi:MAG: ATP-grasp domain-containing protein [Methanomicrobiales archaeon]|nr:ATP-grasp domain-containing protein [Methanomicrobiales archaeon]